jgi:hypothetical protein
MSIDYTSPDLWTSFSLPENYKQPKPIDTKKQISSVDTIKKTKPILTLINNIPISVVVFFIIYYILDPFKFFMLFPIYIVVSIIILIFVLFY